MKRRISGIQKQGLYSLEVAASGWDVIVSYPIIQLFTPIGVNNYDLFAPSEHILNHQKSKRMRKT